MGSVSATSTIKSDQDGVALGELVLRTGDQHWRQRIEVEQLTVLELQSELNRVGLDVKDPGAAETGVWLTASRR